MLLVPCPGCRPTPPAGPGATIGPIPAITSAIDPIDPPAVRLARRSMSAIPGASCAGRSKLVGVGMAATLPCGQARRVRSPPGTKSDSSTPLTVGHFLRLPGSVYRISITCPGLSL
jgi:hypothetical protein